MGLKGHLTSRASLNMRYEVEKGLRAVYSKTHLNNYILWNTLLHLYFCITSVSASDPIMSVHSFPEDFIHYLGFRRSGVTCRDAKVNQL